MYSGFVQFVDLRVDIACGFSMVPGLGSVEAIVYMVGSDGAQGYAADYN